MPPAPRSKQEAFAANLGGTCLGMALYSPIPFCEHLLPTVANIGGILTPPSMPSFTANPSDDRSTQGGSVGARPSGKVGDVAFIARDGKYQWLRNAFHTQVSPLATPYLLNAGSSSMELARVHKGREGHGLDRDPWALSHCSRWPILPHRQKKWGRC
jgi:hypothetical protein